MTDTTLLDELENLQKPDETPAPVADETPAPVADETPAPVSTETNIIDQFTAGDMDAVKKTIHDKVVQAVAQSIKDTE